MTIRPLAVLTLVLSLAAPAAAQFQTVDTFQIKGAYGMIIVPKNWNGSLFIYAHGYSADKRLVAPLPKDPTQGNVLLEAAILPALSGYASAATTFRSVGWDVKDAIKDIENLRRRFVKKYGKPRYTYLWGHSEGGMITSTVIEYLPQVYDGAAPLCGTGAGARRNFDGAFDLRVLYEYACRDVPEARFACRVCSDGKSRCLEEGDCPAGQTCGSAETPAPPEDGLSRECTDFLLDHPDRINEGSLGGAFVAAPVTACFGDLSGTTPPTAEQATRRDFFLRASQIPGSFIGTDLFFATIGLGEVVHHRTHERHPWGNEGVTYAPPRLSAAEQAELNTNVYRAHEDRSAVEYMRRYYEPRGRTGSKVLTVHALDDGLVIPENEDKYREAFVAAGRGDQLVQLFTTTGGHCGFIAELAPTLQALTDWVEKGEKPSTASVHATCPTCDFTDERPGPFGLKVVERRQKGAPLRSLVCGNEAGDCPTASVCSAHLHCR
jgi:pimeloyl-ACP methyl ester carboxylesterase